MKRLMLFFGLLFVLSCGDYIDKPKNLLSKDQMSEILADLSINDQAGFVQPNLNMEAGTRYILKTHHVKPDDFVQSFKYYVIKNQIKDIAEGSQKILMEKDPQAEKYIKDKLKKSGDVSPYER